jgi:hypothetical protein
MTTVKVRVFLSLWISVSLETLIFLVWNYLVFENISESNVSRHLSAIKAVCSCLQLGKLRYRGPNLSTRDLPQIKAALIRVDLIANTTGSRSAK